MRGDVITEGRLRWLRTGGVSNAENIAPVPWKTCLRGHDSARAGDVVNALDKGKLRCSCCSCCSCCSPPNEEGGGHAGKWRGAESTPTSHSPSQSHLVCNNTDDDDDGNDDDDNTRHDGLRPSIDVHFKIKHRIGLLPSRALDSSTYASRQSSTNPPTRRTYMTVVYRDIDTARSSGFPSGGRIRRPSRVGKAGYGCVQVHVWQRHCMRRIAVASSFCQRKVARWLPALCRVVHYEGRANNFGPVHTYVHSRAVLCGMRVRRLAAMTTSRRKPSRRRGRPRNRPW